MKLIFASNNQNKVDEIRAALKKNTFLEILTLKEAGIDTDIPEPFNTLEENASIKSQTIYALAKTSADVIGCFGEDTGLEVDALNGEPGVKSARYAGEQRSFDRNIEKLLQKLEQTSNRSARFRTVISLIIGQKENFFEGICVGTIPRQKKGERGFGYDPVFVPDGAIHTFAEMDVEEKNIYSHRRKAIEKLVTYLAEMPSAEKAG